MGALRSMRLLITVNILLVKQFSLLILLTIFSSNLSSQSWFSDEDTWVYRYFAPFSYEGFAEIIVSEDLMVNGIESHLLSASITAIDQLNGDSIFSEVEIVCYEELGKVYKLNNDLVFELLYDFNMAVGDSITYYMDVQIDGCKDSIVYYLDSLSTIDFGNESLVVQHFSFEDVDWNFQGEKTVVERIGDLNSAFNIKASHSCLTDQPGAWVCSFGNGSAEVNILDEDCYELPVNTSDLSFEAPNIYPNPVNNSFSISNFDGLQSVLIYDMNGLLVSEYNPDSSYDISDFIQGVYVLKIIDKRNNISSSLLFKH